MYQPMAARQCVGGAGLRFGPRRTGRFKNCITRPRTRSNAVGDKYEGVYGEWTVREQDVVEVWSYRVCLSVVALSTVALSTRLGGDNTDEVFCVLGIGALGVALQLIHIYVTPLKRLLQAFWGLGALGYAYLSVADGAAADMSTLDVILAEPWTIWLVGPIGAAITGVTFKEGMCYGKRECYVLTFMVPALFLVHLFGVDQAAPWVGWALDIAVCALGAVFAGRKYTQRLEDDIGDGSVFAFQRGEIDGP